MISCGAQETALVYSMSAEKAVSETLSSTKAVQSSSLPGLICRWKLHTLNPRAGEEVAALNELENSVAITVQDVVRYSEAHENLEEEIARLPTHLPYHNVGPSASTAPAPCPLLIF